ncbi:ATP-binding protein [uncultured Phascolarctobacterium sp.]|uniref:ATP-binding protein n=1 Tax=uncultured Phascolarctobacterium sp. TaxID=512296 RepID=UPI0025EAC386|nr:ATP-binding protein [uncultured Phascolarctobacterium sp.]
MYIARHLEDKIKEASKYYPVVMVCGQRQVGKSTMLYHIKEAERKYVTLDDANARRLAETDAALFFETYGFPLLIDEFQRVPSLLLEMKRLVDEKALKGEKNSGLFWLTGSQKFKMMQGVAESLAGRIAVFDMSVLSAAEIENREPALFRPEISALKERLLKAQSKNVHELYERIFRGGMPKLLATDMDRERFYMDYVNTYLERDIKDLAQVGKLTAFYDFLVFMAARTAQELRYEEIARAVGISAPTAKEWVAILERSGVLFILRPYYSNISKRLVRTPKVYFMDTGLAAYLCRWPNASTLENGAMDGAFLETYVVTEILKSYYNAGKQPDLYYYRDVDKKEIDLLIIDGERIYPIEVKKGKNPSHADKNFSVLDKLELSVQPGLIMCLSDELIPYNRTAWYCPISIL